MMTKNEHLTRAELYAYLDGQLPPETAGAAVGHLESCRRCAGVLQELRRVHGAISSLPLERVDESFTEKVMAQVGLSNLNAGLYRFVVYLPSVVGLALVLGVMGGAYLLAGGAQEHTGLAPMGATLMQTLETSLRTLAGWVAAMGSSGALAITAFALGLLVLVALGDLLPAGTVRKGRGRLRDAPSR